MIRLKKYSMKYRDEAAQRVALFFGFHHELYGGIYNPDGDRIKAAKKTIKDWTHGTDELYMIADGGEIVGFIHINYRGDNVAWIEDIFVDEEKRSNGIATKAISLAEDKVKSHKGYTAVCLDVVPRNEQALRLYHKLGYDVLGMITVRKELGRSDKDKKTEVLGLDFKY